MEKNVSGLSCNVTLKEINELQVCTNCKFKTNSLNLSVIFLVHFGEYYLDQMIIFLCGTLKCLILMVF